MKLSKYCQKHRLTPYSPRLWYLGYHIMPILHLYTKNYGTTRCTQYLRITSGYKVQ